MKKGMMLMVGGYGPFRADNGGLEDERTNERNNPPSNLLHYREMNFLPPLFRPSKQRELCYLYRPFYYRFWTFGPYIFCPLTSLSPLAALSVVRMPFS